MTVSQLDIERLRTSAATAARVASHARVGRLPSAAGPAPISDAIAALVIAEQHAAQALGHRADRLAAFVARLAAGALAADRFR